MMTKTYEIIVIIVSSTVLFTGCISYYRPDPFAGIDFVRNERRATFDIALSRYQADGYFDGEGTTPHTSRSAAPESKFIRSDVVIRSKVHLRDWLGLVVVLPISHIFQRGYKYHDESKDWRVERVWLGTGLTPGRKYRNLSVLFGLGIPLKGDLQSLRSIAPDHDASTRWTLQAIFSNGLPSGHFGFYVRLGLGEYLNVKNDQLHGISEYPGELQFLLPFEKRFSLGLYADARFTLLGYKGRNGTQSRDVIGVGPVLLWQLYEEWRLTANYRKEIIGFKTSAGSSWRIGLAYDFTLKR